MHPFTVVSLDYIKSDRRRDEFLRACPEFVIVEEAHASVGTGAEARNQRFAVLRGLADRPDRHMVFLTATPHSGDENAFHNLLGLLDPNFRALQGIGEGQARQRLRERLAAHFVQRRRADIAEWRDSGSVFPDRETAEDTYLLSGDWGRLFDEVLEYARGMIRRTENQSLLRQRMSWWAALALLRCVSSSPASAAIALSTRLRAVEGVLEREQISDLDERGAETVFDGIAVDSLTSEEAAPAGVTDDVVVSEEDAAALRNLLKRYDRVTWSRPRPKTATTDCSGKEAGGGRFSPNRFLPVSSRPPIMSVSICGPHCTIRQHFVEVITGELTTEERRERIEALGESAETRTPVLVATDCLSEGINLQSLFSAVDPL